MRIGVISDTHGQLDGRVFDRFAGVDLILHAGDLGDDRVLDDLEAIATVHAVSGNVDGTPVARRPLTWHGAPGGLTIAMTHGHLLPGRGGDLDAGLRAAFAHLPAVPRLFVHGHTHKARFETVAGVSYLNPGAACRPRFGATDAPGLAIVEIEPRGGFHVKFIGLD